MRHAVRTLVRCLPTVLFAKLLQPMLSEAPDSPSLAVRKGKTYTGYVLFDAPPISVNIDAYSLQ